MISTAATQYIDKNSFLWEYLSTGQRGLIEEGLFLLEDMKHESTRTFSDYSFVVFPFAKAYEGFLKQLFVDMGFITEKQYGSTHFRIGKVLNPNLRQHLGKASAYNRLVQYCHGYDLADTLWYIWKDARNMIFHYFPHNFQAITLEEAEGLIARILLGMESAVTLYTVHKNLQNFASQHHSFA